MKNIGNEELQSKIRDLIDKKITRKGLAKELETDLRTIHKIIRETSETNPELYEEYIKTFPYKPKTREDIDYEALIIDTIKRKEKLTGCIF